jgi:hypothetical protein
MIEILHAGGGQPLNEEVIWTTKQGNPVHLLASYTQAAYQGGYALPQCTRA